MYCNYCSTATSSSPTMNAAKTLCCSVWTISIITLVDRYKCQAVFSHRNRQVYPFLLFPQLYWNDPKSMSRVQNYTFRVPLNRNGCCMWYSENCRQPYMQFACMPWLFRPIGGHQCSALSYIWMCKLHAYTHKFACTNTHTCMYTMHAHTSTLPQAHPCTPLHTSARPTVITWERSTSIPAQRGRGPPRVHWWTRRSGTIGSRAHSLTIPPGLYVVVSKVTCRGTYTHKHTCAYWHSGWVLTNETYTEWWK